MIEISDEVSKCDVIILGGGPAGATAALALVDSGLHVVLLDKAKFPRDKICGDAIAPYVPKVLRTIDSKYSDAFLAFTEKTEVNICRIVSPNGSILDLKYPETGFIAARMSLDQWMMNQVKESGRIEIWENSAANDIRITEVGVEVDCENGKKLRAELIIGCDGAQGISAKKLSEVKLDPVHHSAAVRAYFKDVTGIPQQTFELHFRKSLLPGYLWIFPLPDNKANVGLGLVSSVISSRKVNLKKELDDILHNDPEISQRFKNANRLGEVQGFGLPLGSRKVKISGDRYMLAGDAASLIDPLTGEGIGQSIISGRYAGWQAKRCFSEKNFTSVFMKGYDDDVYKKVWKDHQRRFRLQRLIGSYPVLFNGIVRIANNSSFVYKIIQKMI